MLLRVLICACLGLRGAAAAGTCGLAWGKLGTCIIAYQQYQMLVFAGGSSVEDTEQYTFVVNVGCLPSGLKITWEVLKNSETTSYNAEVNAICTDTNGDVSSYLELAS